MYLEPIDPDCRKFLKAMRKHMAKHKSAAISTQELIKVLDWELENIYRVADFLEEMHIIRIDETENMYCGFRPTQLGWRYNRYRWYNFKHTFIFSVLLPLVISAISGALTSLLMLSLK